MTEHVARSHVQDGATLRQPGLIVERLRQVLTLVEEIAGISRSSPEAGMETDAKISSAYDSASPIVRRNFDALAGETASWAAAGVKALLRNTANPPSAAAGLLAYELRRALKRLARLLD